MDLYLKNEELTEIYHAYTFEGRIVVEGSQVDEGKLEDMHMTAIELKEFVGAKDLMEMDEMQYRRLAEVYNYVPE